MFISKKSSHILLIFLILTATPALASAGGFSIDDIQADLEKKYSDIGHIENDKVLTLNHEEIVIFDVRERNEFNVSHLRHAIQVEPNISGKEFINKFSDQIRGKTLVFYCSVGQRSSTLASKLKPLLVEQGVHDIYNLKGGIFQWHNEKKPLVKNGELTQLIHPFNTFWGLLIENRQFIKHSPSISAQKE